MKKSILVQGDLTADLFNELSKSTEVGIDCEMMGLNPVRDRLCLLQIGMEGGPYALIQVDEAAGAPKLAQILTDPKILKIFHFARLDCLFIKTRLKTEVKNFYCTKLASRLARTYTDKHGLKELVREFCAESLDKTLTSSDWGNSKLTPDQLKYAEDDIKYLFKLRRTLNEMLVREGREEIYKSCMEFLPVRIEMDKLGYEDVFAH